MRPEREEEEERDSTGGSLTQISRGGHIEYRSKSLRSSAMGLRRPAIENMCQAPLGMPNRDPKVRTESESEPNSTILLRL